MGGESTYFLCANRSKESVAVNLKHPEGQRIVRELARQADVLVENYRLGALEAFGLGYEDLAAINPGLVDRSISGYGRSGPRAAEPGYDFVIQAESGLMSITGEPEGAPMKLGVAITDLVTGMNGVQAILAALLARARSGRGQHIDLALLDGAVSVLANVGAGYLAAGHKPGRLGNGHPTVVPYQIFATRDGSSPWLSATTASSRACAPCSGIRNGAPTRTTPPTARACSTASASFPCCRPSSPRPARRTGSNGCAPPAYPPARCGAWTRPWRRPRSRRAA